MESAGVFVIELRSLLLLWGTRNRGSSSVVWGGKGLKRGGQEEKEEEARQKR